VRPQVVPAQGIDGGIGGLRVKVAGVEDGDFGERSELRRREIFPVEAAVVGDVDQAIVSSRPSAVGTERRGCQSVDNAALRGLRVSRIAILADVGRDLPRLAGQVGADLLPRLAAIASFP
jgi:hypothetical protein